MLNISMIEGACIERPLGSQKSISDREEEEPPTKKGPVFTHKEVATLHQCIEILDWYHKNGKNQTKTAKHFDPIYPNLKIKQPLISVWVKNEAMLQENFHQSDTAISTRLSENPLSQPIPTHFNCHEP